MTKSARNFAIKAHGEQLYGKHPYVVHLDAVAALLAPYGHEAQVVGYLHDVVEDTPMTVADISEKFTPFISRCVDLLTDEPGETRKERKGKTYARLSKIEGDEQLALIVKTADRLANVSASIKDGNEKLLAMYISEHPLFQSSVYRLGLCEPLWIELNNLIGSQQTTQ